MAYTENKKSTGLDSLTPTSTSLVIMGDPADSGRAKKSTIAQVATTILTYIESNLGGIVQSVTGLNTNNSDPSNPVIQISVDGTTITGLGTPGSPLRAIGSSGNDGAAFDGRTKSFSLEGLLGAPIQNGYQNIEAYITSNGTTLYAELGADLLQIRDVVSDWADADQINSYVVNQGYLFLLLQDTSTTTYRVYRYAIDDLASGGALMTIAGQTLGTEDFVMMTSDGTDFFFNYQAGNSTNDYEISKYTIAGTTLTFDSDTSCGAVAHAMDVFIVDSAGHYYGLNTTGVRQVKEFDDTGTLQNTYGPYDSNYTNITNWDDAIYILKSTGDDEAYRITPATLSSGNPFINPSRTSELFEEFIGGVYTTGNIGENGWSGTISGTLDSGSAVTDANHPGVLRFTAGASANYIFLRNVTGDLISGNSRYEFYVKLAVASNKLVVGVTSNPADPLNVATTGLYLKADSSTWVGIYADGAAQNSVGSVATSTGWVKLDIVTNSSGTLASYFVNGTLIGSTAIASTSNNMQVFIYQNDTVSNVVYVDYMHFFRKLTR